MKHNAAGSCLHVQSSAVVELQRLTQNVLPCWSIFTKIQDALLTLHVTKEIQKSEHPSPVERLHNAKNVLMPLKVDIVNILAYILYIGTCYDIPRLHTTKMLVISLEKKKNEWDVPRIFTIQLCNCRQMKHTWDARISMMQFIFCSE